MPAHLLHNQSQLIDFQPELPFLSRPLRRPATPLVCGSQTEIAAGRQRGDAVGSCPRLRWVPPGMQFSWVKIQDAEVKERRSNRIPPPR